MAITNILISGVGGQGIILTSKVLSKLAMNLGYDAKQSEVHGMAQRGGSVVSHVRFGEKIYSPLIKKGGADYILSFELIESVRYLDYLKENGTVISNSQSIIPTSVTAGNAKYPTKEEIESLVKSKAKEFVLIDALNEASKLKNSKVVNIILVGVLAKRLTEIPKEEFLKAIKDTVPAKLLDINLQAFELGYNF